ncbi:maleylacetate reductase [Sulfitobacter sp. F26204]|uniref:maleylacetate reductase n=1 Tax=Sulfitobacter sp. F26204 TaxID=2996014 RepID=UPI00225E0D80|nr:maleylacetate reductase [Sulfitobacter sp. F26204]MCX7561728.1 maleylacetate reductase [Sulfitobacter sp. F26204]
MNNTTVLSFTYTSLPARILFGAGTSAQLPDELRRLSISRPMILTTPTQKDLGERLAKLLGGKTAGVYAQAAMHTPVSVTKDAMEACKSTGADGLVAIGGGSTIGLAKAIALRTDLPQIAMPTTYAGSEMTSIIGQTENGRKTTQKTMKVLPETVIYDVDYTLRFPVPASVTSGMNAIAHAVEALYSENQNPILDLQAIEGLSKVLPALWTILEDPCNLAARTDLLYGAWLCAVCLGTGGVALHHKLCHVLGGTFDLPHAETHTIILPHALTYNASSVPEAMEKLRLATGSEDPAREFQRIAHRAEGVPVALRDLGMAEDGIEKVVQITIDSPYYNPRPLDRDALTNTLRAAWAGAAPGSLTRSIG